VTTLWVNGRLCDPDEPSICALDHGFTVGDGVFETLKVVDGVPFALTRHLERLERSATGLGLRPPDRDRIRAGCQEVLTAQPNDGVLRLRITYSAGRGPLGSDRTDTEPTLVVAASPASAWAPGTAVVIAPWPRNERGALVGLKTTSYADNVMALAWAHERGASEAILLNTRGELCEGTGSNVFVVIEGQVLTPPLSSGCLAGITRQLVLEWTAAQEADLDAIALRQASEAFLTSSTRDVQPIIAVDGIELPAGPVTGMVQRVFTERSEADLDP